MRIEINEEKEVQFFKNLIEKINNFMRKCYQEETPGYIVKELIATSSFKNSVPREIIHILYNDGFNKKQKLYVQEHPEMLSYSVNDGKDLFYYYKDNKKNIKSFEITDDEIIINSPPTSFKLKRVNEYLENSMELINRGELISSFTINDESILNEFINMKGIFKLYLDIDNETITINKIPENTESFIKIIISHKYLTGFSGLKADNMELKFSIYAPEDEESLENIYIVEIAPSNKKQLTSNSFYVVDC